MSLKKIPSKENRKINSRILASDTHGEVIW
jgi:hypothetical protein